MSNAQLFTRLIDNLNNSMKKILLTLFFATYYFFMPFVMVNCISVADKPYALDADASLSDEDGDYTPEECQQMEFTITACIDVLQQEDERIKQEKSTINNGALLVADFETCQSQVSISSDTTQAAEAATDVATLSADATTEETDETASSDEGDEANDTESASDTETVSGPDCESIIADMIAAYQICDELKPADKYEECEDVESTMDDAVEKCDAGDESVTEDFCSSLTA
ncbi:MAG: hypothetical protein HQM16_18560 [Deltaproteobacteria bacterium]|nr:hypothetical protein [Deltaproteobacteria bacterium]